MWHAVIRVETTDEEFEQLDELFIAYLAGLEDRREQELANAVFMLLLDTIANHFDSLPKCTDCGSILCPHCGRHGRLPEESGR